ncbi:hypothetical protein D3C76_230610 [compost metagenome]
MMLERHFIVTHTETDEKLVLASSVDNEFFLVPWIEARSISMMIPFENPKDLEIYKNNNIYRHYKGSIYKTYFEASHINTGEIFIIYSSDEYEKKSIYWARPKEMFHSYYNDTNVLRFTLINEGEIKNV